MTFRIGGTKYRITVQSFLDSPGGGIVVTAIIILLYGLAGSMDRAAGL